MSNSVWESGELAALAQTYMNNIDVITEIKHRAQVQIDKAADPSRYRVVEEKDSNGNIIVTIVDILPDAILYESQTGELLKIEAAL